MLVRFSFVPFHHADGHAILCQQSTSVLPSFFGCVMVLWTLTLMCVPASRGTMHALGVCFALVGVLEGLTALLYQTQDCKSQSFDMIDGINGGGGYLRGGKRIWYSALHLQSCT